MTMSGDTDVRRSEKILGIQLSLSQGGSAEYVLQESMISPRRLAIRFFHLDPDIG